MKYKFIEPVQASNRLYYFGINPLQVCRAWNGEIIVTVQLADGGFQYTYLSNLVAL